MDFGEAEVSLPATPRARLSGTPQPAGTERKCLTIVALDAQKIDLSFCVLLRLFKISADSCNSCHFLYPCLSVFIRG